MDNHSVCVDFSGDGEHYFMGVRVDFTCEGEFVVQEYNLTFSTLKVHSHWRFCKVKAKGFYCFAHPLASVRGLNP